jgi:hypothetical protein
MVSTLQGPWDSITALDVFLYAAIALLAVTVFAVPLEGMHGRLQDEKNRALRELTTLLRTASNRLHRDVLANEYEDMGRSKDAISALFLELERLEKTSTWPWDPSTIRGFASTLLLPIFLIQETRFLERLL